MMLSSPVSSFFCSDSISISSSKRDEKESSAVSKTLFSSFIPSLSCSKNPTVAPLLKKTLPSVGFSQPYIILNNEVFPAPFAPIIPTFAPSLTANVISQSTSFVPYESEMPSHIIILILLSTPKNVKNT